MLVLKNYWKLHLFILLGLFLIASIPAQEFQGDISVIRFYGEINQPLNIYEKCIVNGFACDSNFICNLTTIETSTQSVIVRNVLMSRDQTVYNFTLNSTQNSKLGLYEDTVTCQNSSVAGTNTFYHRITPSGAPPIESGQGFTLLGTLGLLVLAIIIILFLGIFVRNAPASLFLILFSVLLLVGTIGFGFTVMEELFGLYTDILSSYGIFYRLLIILITGGSIGLILYLVVVALKALQIKRGLRDEM